MRLVLSGILLAALATGGAWVWAGRAGAIAPIAPLNAASFDAALVARGEVLATFGGCESCHGQDLSGGIGLPTPFGTIHSTNITPDPDTGIGTWSEVAFTRAMRQGISRDGHLLYPAFPYDSFTNTSDADLAAIYAYLMSRPAVAKPAQPDALPFPFNIRRAMAGWNLLYLRQGPLAPDPARDEAWNRGAYLAEGLGHCAACHTPRNRFGARDAARPYAGALVEGWYAPALNASSPAPVPWTQEALLNYFYDGWDADHGIAAGPMQDVQRHTAALPEEDTTALADYVLSLQSARDPAAAEAARSFAASAAANAEAPGFAAGQAVFEKSCQNCHRDGTDMVPLGLSSAVNLPTPANLYHVVTEGVVPSESAYFVKPMPGFPLLGEEDLTALARYVRQRFSTKPAWTEADLSAALTAK